MKRQNAMPGGAKTSVVNDKTLSQGSIRPLGDILVIGGPAIAGSSRSTKAERNKMTTAVSFEGKYHTALINWQIEFVS